MEPLLDTGTLLEGHWQDVSLEGGSHVSERLARPWARPACVQLGKESCCSSGPFFQDRPY